MLLLTTYYYDKYIRPKPEVNRCNSLSQTLAETSFLYYYYILFF